MKKIQGPSLFTRVVAAFAMALVPFATAPTSFATTYYWDSDGNATSDNSSTGAGLGGPSTNYVPTTVPGIPLLPTAGVWDTSSLLWWDGVSGSDATWTNSGTNTAYFWAPNATVGANTVPGDTISVVSLGAAIQAGSLVFNTSSFSDYIINNGNNLANTLTLGSATNAGIITVGNASGIGGVNSYVNVTGYITGAMAEIDAQIVGTSGITVNGGGYLTLGNSSNSYTGYTNITNATVAINNIGALGVSNTTVIIDGVANYGLPGGTLIVGGGVIGGLGTSTAPTISRSFSLSGDGVGRDFAGGTALQFVGTQTVTGNLNFGTNGESRLVATGGTLTINGSVSLDNSGQSPVIYGLSTIIINGQVFGADSNSGNGLIKTGGGVASTLILTNPNNDFSGDIRIDSGTLRVSQAGALGINLTTETTATHIDFNGGTLELRVDPANVAGFAVEEIAARSSTVNVFVDRAVGGSGLNQTVSFLSLELTGSRTYAFTGGDGYGITFNNMAPNNGTLNATINIANGSNGLLTINATTVNPITNAVNSVGSFWNITDVTGSRLMELSGNGDSLLMGNIIATSAVTANGSFIDHSFEKAGAGTLTLTATNSTYTGGTFVEAGTLSVNQIGGASGGALNGVAGGVLNLGSGGTFAALNYMGAAGTGAGETTAKALSLGGTTGAGIILANQAGTAPSALTFLSNVAADSLNVNNATGSGGAKTLFLGGNSAANLINTLNGVVVDEQALGTNYITSLNKVGTNTWLYSPSASNYVTTTVTAAATTTTNGSAAASQANIVLTSVTGLSVGQVVSGTNIPSGAFIVAINTGTNTITLNTNILTAVATATTLGFSTVAATGTSATVAGETSTALGNVIGLSSVAGLVVGQAVTGGTTASNSVPAGSIITSINTTNNTITISNNIANAIAAGTTLYFGQVNDFTGSVSIGGGTLQIQPTAATGNGSNVINDTSAIIFNQDALAGYGNAGGTLQYIGMANTASTELVGALTPQAGGSTVQVTPTGATGSAALTFASLGTITAGATVNFVTATGGTVTINGLGVTAGIVNPHLFFNGADFAYYTGSGALTIPTYDGTELASGIAAAINTGGSLTASKSNEILGNVAVAANTTISSLKMLGSDTLSISSGVTLTFAGGTPLGGTNGGGGLIQTGGAGIITGGSLSGGGELIINVNLGTDSLNIASILTSGNTNVTKTGAGLLILGTSVTGTVNANTGTFTIDQGSVQLQGTATTLGSSTVNLTMRQNTQLDLNGAGVGGLVAVGTLQGSGTITNSSAGSNTLQVTQAANGTFSGLLQNGSGTLSLTKLGGSALALTGSNTFTGVVTISAGVLEATSLGNIGVPSSIGEGNLANNAGSLVFNGGILQYTGDTTGNAVIYQTTQTPSISINRLFTLAGNGTIDSSGTYGNVVDAAASQNNAALIFNNQAAVAFSGTGARTLTLQGSSTGDNEIDLNLIDNTNGGVLNVTKAGAGLWILNPSTNNLYTGQTLITGGQLQAVDGVGISTASNIEVNATAGGTALIVAGGTTSTTVSTNYGTGPTFSSGVLQTSGTFARTIGTTTGDFFFGTGGGGFAASSAPLVVNLQDATAHTATITLGTTNFPNNTIILNSVTALSDVTLINPINLNGKLGFILVDDNGTTNTDFATMPAVVSDSVGAATPATAGSFVKQGSGELYLTGANTYVGNTYLLNGTLILNSIGNSTSTSSNLGEAATTANGFATTTFGTTTGILQLGDSTQNSAVYLEYVGQGETTDRLIQIGTSTSGVTIDSSGTGPLVLTNVQNAGAGVHTLTLRGFNTGNNMITSNLADVGTNVLNISKSDSSNWILTGDNSFNGTVTVSSGLLGITNINPVTGVPHVANTSSLGNPKYNTAGSLGAPTIASGNGAVLLISNGGIFAVDGPTTINNLVEFNGNAQNEFAGQYAITIYGSTGLNQNITLVSNGGVWITDNEVAPVGNAASLIFNGNLVTNDTTAGRAYEILGTGNTTYNGSISNNTGGGTTEFLVETSGIVTMNALSNYSASTVLEQGTVVIGIAPSGGNTALGVSTGLISANGGFLQNSVSGGVTIPNPVTFANLPFTFNGVNQFTITGNVTNSASNRVLENDDAGGLTISGSVFLSESSTARQLDLTGTNNITISGVIANASSSGTASNLLYTSSALGTVTTLTLSNTETYTGATIVASGIIDLSGKLATGSGITVDPTGTLTLDNSGGVVTNRLGSTPLTLAGGTLNFVVNGSASTSETSTAVLNISGVASTITMNGTANTNTITFSQLVLANSGSMLLVNNANLGTAADKIVFSNGTPVVVTAASSTSAIVNGIIDRVVINGTDFGAYGANGLVANASYTSALTGNPITSNVKLTASPANLATSQTVNSLTINSASAVNITGSANTALSLISGGLLVAQQASAVSDTLSVPVIVEGVVAGPGAAVSPAPVVYVGTNATLTISGSQWNNNLGWAKQGGGTLILGAEQWLFSTQNLIDGTTQLNGGLNTLFQGQALNLGTNAILDLDGNNQYIGALSGNLVVNNQVGNGSAQAIINSNNAVTVTLVTSGQGGGGNFAGAIGTNLTNNNINFVRSGGNTTNLYSPSLYSGATLINGGTLQLLDQATILNTSSIEVDYGTLALNNNNVVDGTYDISARVPTAAPLTFRGGTLTFTARDDFNDAESFGSVTLAEGANTISANLGGIFYYSSAILTFSSLNQTGANNPATNGATVNFTSGNNLGAIAQSGQIFFATTPTSLPDGALGAWAIVNSTDFAAYNPAVGVGAINSTGFQSYNNTLAAGNVTELPADSVATVNNLTAASNVTDLLRLSGAFENDITFSASGNVLNLQYGGLLRSNNFANSIIGTPTTRGVLTAGMASSTGNTELVTYYANTTNSGLTGTTLNSLLLGSNVLSLSTVLPVTGNIILPGMLVTGTGLAPGTTVVSVNYANNTVTLSAPASQNVNAGTFTFISNVTINSVIEDTSAAVGGVGTVSFVKSGAGVVNLTAPNAFTGGTVVDQGTLNLMGSAGTVVLPNSTNGIVVNGGVIGAGAALVEINAPGQIGSGNTLTMNGGSTVTLFGNNTLVSLTINNDGNNTTPTLNTFTPSVPGGTTGTGTLFLTSNTPITATSTNVATTPIINGFLSFASGLNTISVGSISPEGTADSTISPTLNIAASIYGSGVSIQKTGTGILELAGQSNFTGGLEVKNGGLFLGSNSTQGPTGAIISGPVGTGTLTMDSGTTLLVGATQTLSNPVVFQGEPLFDSTAATAVTLTLNGTLTIPVTAGVLSVNVNNPNLTVSLLGATFTNSFTSVTKTGLGLLLINPTVVNVPINAMGPLSLLLDGNGTGDRETIAINSITFDPTTAPVLTIGRAGTDAPYTAAVNKIVAPSSFSTITNGLTLTANNDYGLQLSDNYAFTQALTINVIGATSSNVIQGLYLNGQLTGTVTTLTKTGTGTLVLGNNASSGTNNTFGGNIDITGGVVSVSSDAALGAASNVVILDNGSLSINNGFRATGSFIMFHTIKLDQTTNEIEVASVNPMGMPPGLTLGAALTPSTPYTLTLSSPFTFQTSGTGDALAKNDDGILNISANNTGWTGAITVNAGAIEASNANAFGSGAITLQNVVGDAVQIGGVSISNTLNLSNTGLSNRGALEGLVGTATESGAIVLTNSTSIGADAGGVLNLTGTLNGASATAQTLLFEGAGTINLSTSTSVGASTAISTITKIGTGTLNVTTAQSSFVVGLTINNGLVDFAGATAALGAASAQTVTVTAGGQLTVDDSTNNLASRLGGRNLTLTGGVFNYLGSSTATSLESLNALGLSSGGQSVINITQGAGQATNLVFASMNRASTDTTLLINLVSGATLATASTAGKSTLSFTSTSGVTTSGTATNGNAAKSIIPWAVVFDGANYTFAALDSGTAPANTFVRPLGNVASGEEVNTVTAADNVALITSGVAATATTASITLNSLQLGAAGGVVGGLNLNGLTTLTLGNGNAIGAILASGGGADFISGGVQGTLGATATGPGLITTGNNAELMIHVEGATTTLTINSILGNMSQAFTKDGAGTLILTTQEMYTSTTAIDAGTLQLGATGSTPSAATTNIIRFNQNLRLEGGATVNLNGNVQTVAIFLNDVTQPDNTGVSVGGQIINTNSAVQATFTTENDNNGRNWAGVIGGTGGTSTNNIAWERGGVNNLIVYSNQTFAGAAFFAGGTTILESDGGISNSSGITIGYATLQVDNNGGLSDNPDRIGNGIPITLIGGTLTFVSRVQTASSETLGSLTVSEGANTINMSQGGTGVNSADLYFSNLVSVAPGATLNFNVDGVIGSARRVHFGTPLTLNSSGVLGAAYIANSTDFATYGTDMGVGAVGASGFRGYDSNFATGAITQMSATTALNSPITNTGMLKINGAVPEVDLFFSSGSNVLDLEQGGLLRSNNIGITSIGTPSAPGILTAGTAASTGNTQLVVFSAALNQTLAGNATASTVLGSNTLTLTALSNVAIGEIITGPDIPLGTTVTGFNANTLTVTMSNAATGSLANVQNFNFWSNTTINSAIEDTSAAIGGTGTVSLVKSGTGILTLTGTNSYTGGTVVDQGTLILAGNSGQTVIPGNLTINGGNTQQYASVEMLNNQGQIASSSVVTINGSGLLYTTGNNTLNSLVFNNDGGSPMNQPTNLNPYLAPILVGNLETGMWQSTNGYMLGGFVYANGALTLTGGTITASSDNPGAVSTLAGRADLGAGAITVSATPITFNSQSTSPLEATFAFQGLYGSTGGLVLTGGGVIEFTAQDTYTGPTHVENGTSMLIGEYNSGSRFSAVTLDSGTTLNLGGVSTVIGSLSGSGVVTNTGTNQNGFLTVGYDNTSTTFSGQFNRFNDSLPASVSLIKVGSGNFILTGAAAITTNASNLLVNSITNGGASTGTAVVEGGTVTYTGAGTGGFLTYTLEAGGSLVLDNGSGGTAGAGANVNYRLFNSNTETTATLINDNGGAFALYGNSTASTPTLEKTLTLTIGQGTGNIVLSAAGGNALTFTAGTLTGVQAGGTAILRELGTGTDAFVATTVNAPSGQGGGAAGNATVNIRPDILVDNIATGLDANLVFATTVAATTTGLRGLASNEMSGALTGTAGSTGTNYVLSANDTFGNTGTITSQSANSLTLQSGVTILGTLPGLTTQITNYNVLGALETLTVTTGGILANSGASVIDAGVLTTGTGTNQLYFYTNTSSTSITVNAYIGAITNLTASLNGTVTLDENAYYNGTTTVNGGTLVLNSGGANTLLVNPTGSVPTVTNLQVNGGTFDLNGNNQVVGQLLNNNPLPNSGGVITNSVSGIANRATLTIVNNTAFQVFGGQINGNLNFTKYGNNNTTLTSAEGYLGATVVGGATLFLRDSAVLTNSTSITANYATFEIDNSGLNPVDPLNPNLVVNRIPSVTNITLKGGTFFINGAGTQDTILTTPQVTLLDGQNSINMQPAVNSGSTTILTITNLAHTSSESVINFNGFVGTRLVGGGANNNGGASPENFSVNTLGQSNLFTSSNIYITNLNGSAFSTTNLVNNLIGGWAVANGGGFASYSNTYGVGNLGADPSYATYDNSSIISGNQATYNITESNSGTRAITASETINSVLFSANASQTITLASNVVLTLNVGFVQNSNTAMTIGPASSATGESLTGGTVYNTLGVNTGVPVTDLYMYVNQTTVTINVPITDNGAAGGMNLVKEGGAILALAPTVNNTYLGTTYVQSGSLNLAGTTAGIIAVPGNLVVNAGTVTEQNVGGQIAATSNVTLNGNSTLVLPSWTVAQGATVTTLASLTFNNPGGSATPGINFNVPLALSTLVLTSNTPLTSTNDNYGFTPSFFIASGGNLANTALQFTGTAPVITVSGASPDDLIIPTTLLTDPNATTITKTGTGGLALTAANTFTNNFLLSQGLLILGNNTALGVGGTFTMGSGAGTTVSVQTDGTARTIANTVVVNGNVTFGGDLVGDNLTFSGPVGLGTSSPILTVSSPLVTTTISGAITSTATTTAFTKAGPGTLLISSGSNSLGTGGVVVSGGVLELGSIVSLTGNNAVQVSAGAVLDTHGMATESIGSLSGDTTTTGGMVTNGITATTSVLTIGGDNTSPTFAGIITDGKGGAGGTGALALTKTGSGTQTLSGANSYSGATTVGGTGALQIQNISSSATFATLGNTAITVNSGATFMPTVASGAPTTVINAGSTAVTTGGSTLTLNGGSTLDMRDGSLGTFNLIQGATFAGNAFTVGGVTTTLDFDIGNGGADLINITKNASITGGTITLNVLAGATSLPIGVIPLIESGGGFTGTGTNNFTLSTTTLVVGGKTYTLTLAGAQDTTKQTALLISVAAPINAYWSGAIDNNWSTITGGSATNWRTDATSNIDTQSIPTANTNVFFDTTNPAATHLSTTLGGAISINGLTFTSAATAAVTIDNGGVPANTLTLGTGGITLQSGAGGATISANVVLNGSQTWSNSSSNPLAVSGVISGNGSPLTISGTGITNLSGANTYNGGTTIAGGTVLAGVSNVGTTSGALGTGSVTLGAASGSSDASLLTNGAFTVSNAINVAAGSSGNTLAIGGNTDNNSSFTGAITLNNNLTVSQAANAGANALSISGGITGGSSGLETVTFAGPGNIKMTSAIADGTPGNPVAVAVTGGTTVLSVANTYSGTTTVNGGNLQVGVGGTGTTGSGPGTSGTGTTGTGAVTVNNGGTLSGTGIVGGVGGTANHAVTAGGTLAPGDNGGTSLGTLTVNGNLNLGTAGTSTSGFSTTNLKISQTGTPHTNDFIVVNGNLTLNGGSNINLVDASGFVANAFQGEVIDLMSWTTLASAGFVVGTNGRIGGNDSGADNLNLPTLGNGLSYDVSSFLTSGTITVVPEPGRMLLLAFGMAALMMRRRRRQ